MEEKINIVENTIEREHELSDECLPNISLKIENNLNDCLILIDDQLQTNNDCQRLFDDLGKLTNENILGFNNIESITSFFQMNTIMKIFLIISDSLEQKYRKQIQSMINIECIYIFCHNPVKQMEWLHDIRKIRGVFDNTSKLFAMISCDIKELANRWKFNDESSFLKASLYDIRWYHLFIKILIHLPCTNNNWNEMLNECRSSYKDNPRMLQKINDFQREYTHNRAIYYYTQDSFIYRIINSALRTHNTEIISKFYPFIQDLSKELDKHYKKYCFSLQHRKSKSSPLRVVYRGQLMSNNELERLRKLCKTRQSDVLLSMFGSTSRDPAIAMSFIAGANNCSETTPCLFEIIIPDYYYYLGNQASPLFYHSQMFLDISDFSAMHEQEVLFSVMSRFRVKYIGHSTSERVWIPIILEFVRDNHGFDPYWHKIKDMVSHESDEMKKELFELVRKYENKSINWDVWWPRLKGEFGRRRRDGEPFVVTLCECFGDEESLTKAIELRKKDLENNKRWTNLSDHERFSSVIEEMKYGGSTRIIALYELFFQNLYSNMNLSEFNMQDIIQSLKHVGDQYRNCANYNKKALECYEKALELAQNYSDHKMISYLQRKIKELSSHQQSDYSKKQKETSQIKNTKSSSLNETFLTSLEISDCEIENLQWSTLWYLRKIARDVDVKNLPQIRLKYLLDFLKDKENWLDNTHLRIFLQLPFQNNNNKNFELPENIDELFYLSIWSYLYEDMLCFKNPSVNKWKYEQFMNEWLTLNDLKRRIKFYNSNEYSYVTTIMIILERILKKLALIITMCIFIITVPPGTDRHHIIIDVDQINLLTDACVDPQKLIFFDIQDKY